jgi:hypothetical protein
LAWLSRNEINAISARTKHPLQAMKTKMSAIPRSVPLMMHRRGADAPASSTAYCTGRP